VFYEALRLFRKLRHKLTDDQLMPAVITAPAYVLLREAREDTILKIPNPVGVEGSTTVPIQKGVTFLIDMVGTREFCDLLSWIQLILLEEYNPRYFDEPEKYKPSRWYGATSESEAFSLFSVGKNIASKQRFFGL
jgi:hypothetical protein